MTTDELIAELPAVACMAVTLAAFSSAGAWRALRVAGATDARRMAMWKFATPALLALAVVAAVIAWSPEGPLPPDSATPKASYNAKSALIQLAVNAALAAPFIAWVVWRRKGAAALGIGQQDALRSLAIGACVSLACVAMLGKLSASFWSSPGTWWLLLAMLGVGASEELIFRGLLLGSLAKRLSRPSAEVWSAIIFSVVHIPQRIGVGMSTVEIAVSVLILFIWGWCYAAAMRTGRNVPGLALVHAITNVCVIP
jgi:membrane protease YdiL (CAAX protease family)